MTLATPVHVMERESHIMIQVSGRSLNGIRVIGTIFGVVFGFLVFTDIFRWHDSVSAVIYDAIICMCGFAVAVWMHLALNRRRLKPLKVDDISGIREVQFRFTNAIPQQGGNYTELARKLNRLAQYATVPGWNPWYYDPFTHCTTLRLLGDEANNLAYELDAARRAIDKYAMTLRGRKPRVLVAATESVTLAEELPPGRS